MGRDLSERSPPSETDSVQLVCCWSCRRRQRERCVRSPSAQGKSLWAGASGSPAESQQLVHIHFNCINNVPEAQLLTFPTVPLHVKPSPTKLPAQLQVRTPGPVMLHLAFTWQPPFPWKHVNTHIKHCREMLKSDIRHTSQYFCVTVSSKTSRQSRQTHLSTQVDHLAGLTVAWVTVTAAAGHLQSHRE